MFKERTSLIFLGLIFFGLISSSEATRSSDLKEIEGVIRVQKVDPSILMDDSTPSVILQQLDPKVKQAILVRPTAPGSMTAQLSTWESRDNIWHSVFKDWAAVVGRNGIAPAAEKKEGDGRTPSGIYKLGAAFGYARSIDTNLEYYQVTTDDFWVDDPTSKQYNQWVTGKPVAKSFERMKRNDGLYKYGIVIQYNMDPVVAGNGSAIFLHVWRDANSSTAGCVAVSEDNLLKILHWLDLAKNPVILIHP